MPCTHSLGGIHRDDFPEHARGDDLVYLRVKRRVAKDVTDEHPASEFRGAFFNGEHIFGTWSNGLFEEDVVAFLHGRKTRFDMILVLGADDQNIGKPGTREKLLVTCEGLKTRIIGKGANHANSLGDGIGGGGDFVKLRHFCREFKICPRAPDPRVIF